MMWPHQVNDQVNICGSFNNTSTLVFIERLSIKTSVVWTMKGLEH